MLPQRWAIAAITMLEQRWPSSRIASRILSLGLMFPGQTVPSDCRRVAISFDVSAWGVSHERHVCPPGVGSQIGRHMLISGRV